MTRNQRGILVRTISRLIAVTAVAALGLGLAGCGGTSTPPTAHSTVTASTGPAPSVPSSPTTSPDPASALPKVNPVYNPKTGLTDYCGKRQAPFSGPAARQFGAANVMTAYCEMVSVAITDGFTNLMVDRPHYKVQDFQFLKTYMTPHEAKQWDTDVKHALAGDSAARNSVYALTTFGPTGDYTVDPKGPFTMGTSFTPAKASVVTLNDGTKALGLVFSVSTNVLLHKDGHLYKNPFTRNYGLSLVPGGSPQAPWLIASYKVTWQSGRATKIS